MELVDCMHFLTHDGMTSSRLERKEGRLHRDFSPLNRLYFYYSKYAEGLVIDWQDFKNVKFEDCNLKVPKHFSKR